MTYEQLRSLAEQGDVNAQFAVGIGYRLGTYEPANKKKSADWLELAATNGHPAAAYELAVLFDESDVNDVSGQRIALKYYARAAEGGHPLADIALNLIAGYMALENGSDSTDDELKADRAWQAASRVALNKFTETSHGSLMYLIRLALDVFMEQTKIDAWIPILNFKVRELVGQFLLGFAQQLGEEFGISNRISKYCLALVYADLEFIQCQNAAEAINEILVLENQWDSHILKQLCLSEYWILESSPESRNQSKISMYAEGAMTGTEWLRTGINNTVSTIRLLDCMQAIERNAGRATLNPLGILDPFQAFLGKDLSQDDFFSNNRRLTRLAAFRHYPLGSDTLERIKKINGLMDWSALSANTALPWSLELIKQHEHLWDWEYLASNTTIPWSVSLVKTFSKYFDNASTQFKLGCNSNLKLDPESVEEVAAVLGWQGICYNSSIKWTPELIEKYIDKICWRSLSANRGLLFSPKLISLHKEKWDWLELSGNPAVPLTIDLIRNFRRNWRWSTLSSNPSLLISDDLIDEFVNWLVWEDLCKNANLELSENLMRFHKGKIVWESLSENTGLPWSYEFFLSHIDKWDWDAISCNPAAPWSMKLIKEFEEQWLWKPKDVLSRIMGKNGISGNSGIPWSHKIVERFIDKIDVDLLVRTYDAGVKRLSPNVVESLITGHWLGGR
jgi:hypothetical protein